jgi:hypothetical protein
VSATDRISELSRIICAEVPALIEDARDQINASIDAIMEQAQETEDAKAVLTLSISAKWDLDGQSVVVSMPVNVRHKFSRTASMDDPQQPSLPLDPVRQEAMDAVEQVKAMHAARLRGSHE